MNHYPHHVGDFNNATRHLTFVERALYRELLDVYYDTEQPLNRDVAKLARRVLAHTDEQRAALESVLEEFFEPADDGWRNNRCDREIAAYRQKQEQQSRAGQASAAKRGTRKGGATPVEPAASAAAGVGAGAGSTPVERPLNGRGTNQNQNHNQIEQPPNPPSGGAGAALAAQREGGQPADRQGEALALASSLAAFFPEKRRNRLAIAAAMLVDLQAGGVVTADALLAAARAQESVMASDGGKASPSVVRWLRDRRWLDSAGTGHTPANWRESRSTVEAMGARVGLPPFEQSGFRLLSGPRSYEAEVARRLNPEAVPA